MSAVGLVALLCVEAAGLVGGAVTRQLAVVPQETPGLVLVD